MPASNRSLRFGVFELRPATQELYKGVIRMKLRPQAFQVLEMLAEKSFRAINFVSGCGPSSRMSISSTG
jgi:DNA-binding response OmpR family regulator